MATIRLTQIALEPTGSTPYGAATTVQYAATPSSRIHFTAPEDFNCSGRLSDAAKELTKCLNGLLVSWGVRSVDAWVRTGSVERAERVCLCASPGKTLPFLSRPAIRLDAPVAAGLTPHLRCAGAILTLRARGERFHYESDAYMSTRQNPARCRPLGFGHTHVGSVVSHLNARYLA